MNWAHLRLELVQEQESVPEKLHAATFESGKHTQIKKLTPTGNYRQQKNIATTIIREDSKQAQKTPR